MTHRNRSVRIGRHIRLKRQLFDIFQHCELKCTAACCGWDALDLSAHWLNRWCEFRELTDVRAALAELKDLHHELSYFDTDDTISVFSIKTDRESLHAQLNHIEDSLKSFDARSSE